MTEELQVEESAAAGPTAEFVPVSDPERAEELVNVATEALAAGQVQRALRLAQQATAAAPDLPNTWLLLAMVAEEAKHASLALEAYRRVQEFDPDRPGVVERIAELELEVQAAVWEQESRAPSTTLDRYAPMLLAVSVAMLILAIGLAIVARGQRVATSAQQYTRVMQQGREAMALQQYDRAEAAFADALRLYPDDRDAYAWLERARQGRSLQAQVQQWQYQTEGGRFPGVQGEISPSAIAPTAERKAAEAAAQAGAANYPSPHAPQRYTWRGDTHADRYTWGQGSFPPPRQELGPEFGSDTQSPATLGSQQPGQPTQPSAPQQPSPLAPAQPSATPPADTATQPPKGYIHITVGEPKPQPRSGGESAVSGDQVRAGADALRHAGRTAEAKKQYQRAIELYQREAQADPQARAVKQAGIDSCRRALEQSQ